MRKRFALVIIGVALILAIVSGSLLYSLSQQGFAGKTESVTIGNAQSFECDTLIYVAAAQGFFSRNGLDVNVLNYTSGLAAVNAMLDGNVDIAATAEFPLVGKAFGGENISAIASIGRFQLQDLIGVKSRGVEGVADLVGKRVGIPLGTISEFYFGRFLDLHGLGLRNVTVVNVNPLESVSAITNGSVDALVIWQPYAYEAEERLGNDAIVWSVQSGQRLYIVEVAENDWISQHSNLVERYLNSLAQAEDYFFNHPSEVRDFMQNALNYTDEYMTAIWGKNEFSLFLDQSLILAVEDEARWMIRNNLTNETKVPNFLDFVYLDGLKAVKPGSVNIIR